MPLLIASLLSLMSCYRRRAIRDYLLTYLLTYLCRCVNTIQKGR